MEIYLFFNLFFILHNLKLSIIRWTLHCMTWWWFRGTRTATTGWSSLHEQETRLWQFLTQCLQTTVRSLKTLGVCYDFSLLKNKMQKPYFEIYLWTQMDYSEAIWIYVRMFIYYGHYFLISQEFIWPMQTWYLSLETAYVIQNDLDNVWKVICV